MRGVFVLGLFGVSPVQLAFSIHICRLNYKNLTGTQKTGNAGCWLVGLGDNLRGRRESVLKSVFSKPFHPARFQFLRFPLHSYKALKASNHLLYSDSISNETLGFRSSSICLKSPIVIDLGLASLSIALPDSKNSPISFN
jgi:hypothetical protein